MHRIGLLGAALLVLVALASSCSGGASDEPAPPFQRIDLRPADAAAAAAARGAPRVVKRLQPREPLDRWRIRADGHALESVDPGATGTPREALILTGGGAKSVEIPGRYEVTSFNRVRATIYYEKPASVRVALGRTKERRQDSSGFMRVEQGPAVRTLELDVRDFGRHGSRYDRLALQFAASRDRVGLVELELVQVPWPSLLPDPSGAAAPVLVGREWRAAKALSSGVPLVASVRVPPSASLRVAFGLPEVVRRAAGKQARVKIVLTRAGAPPDVHVFPVETRRGRPAAWLDETLDLAAHAGKELRIQVSAEGAPELVVAAVEPLLVTQPRAPAAAGASGSERAPPPPTVVLVTSDTHRGDHLGAAARSVGVRTPFLDALAARGVLYENCWSSANVTNPSHVALFTGSTPRETGVVANVHRLDDAAPTLAEAFRDAGYLTFAAVSAPHLAPSRSGLGQGFDRVNAPPHGQRDGADTIAELVRWLPEAEGMPLFVWLHLFDAHAPYEVAEPYRHLYYPPDGDPYRAELPELPFGRQPAWDRAVRDVEWVRAQYKSQITYLDERLAALFAEPRLERAIVAITADHGETLDEHAPSFSHAGLYRATLHVPLVLSWPDGPRGVRVERAVRQIDVSRTLLDLAGLGATQFPGRNLARELEATDEPPPRFAIASDATQASVQSGRWLLVMQLRMKLQLDSRLRSPHSVALYDLEADPDCKTSLTEREHEQAARLRRVLVDWLVAPRASSWRRDPAMIDAAEIAELAEMGYADSGSEGETEWIEPDCDCERCAAFQ